MKNKIAFNWTSSDGKSTSTVSLATIKSLADGSEAKLDELAKWAKEAKPGDTWTDPDDGATFTAISN